MTLITKTFLAFIAVMILLFNLYINFTIRKIEDNLEVKRVKIDSLSCLLNSIYLSHNIENISDSLILSFSDTLETYDYLQMLAESKSEDSINKSSASTIRSLNLFILEGKIAHEYHLSDDFTVRNLNLRLEIVTSIGTKITDLSILESFSEDEKKPRPKLKNIPTYHIRNGYLSFDIENIQTNEFTSMYYDANRTKFGQYNLSLLLKGGNKALRNNSRYQFSYVYLYFPCSLVEGKPEDFGSVIQIEKIKKYSLPKTELPLSEKRHKETYEQLIMPIHFYQKKLLINQSFSTAAL